MFNEGDSLLYALSAWRNTSWSSFKECFDTLYQQYGVGYETGQYESVANYRWKALRTLRCLGHIDIRFDSGRIQDILIAPPTLAALPGFGVRKAVLCGSRAPNTIGELRRAAAVNGALIKVDDQSKSLRFTPTRVELQADHEDAIQDVAESCGISYSRLPSARFIAEFSTSLQDYWKRLRWLEEDDLNWQREDFDIDSLRFRRALGSTPRIRLSRYQHPVTSLRRFRLWKDGNFTDIDLEWGKYAILALCSRPVLRYDRAARRLAVPSATPLPGLLSRAIGLCSGYPPESVILKSEFPPAGVHHYDVFRDVPPSVFETVADKVETPLI